MFRKVSALLSVLIITGMLCFCVHAETSLSKDNRIKIVKMNSQGTHAVSTQVLPCSIMGDDRVRGFNMYSNGNVDLILETTTRLSSGAKSTYKHYHSSDGGKTWSTKSTSWINTFQKKYGKGNSSILSSVFIDEKGTLYSIVNAGSFSVNYASEKLVDVYPTYKILKGSNGVMKEIPNLSLKSQEVVWRKIIGIKNNGDIIISGFPWKVEKSAPAVCIIDGDTGAMKAEYKLTFLPEVYANDKVYGYQFITKKNPVSHFCAADMNTGKETLSITMGESFDVYLRLAAEIDGTLYYVNEKGLYRLPPNASTFEKLLDKKACVFLDHNMHIFGMAGLNDGKFCVLAQYFNYENDKDPLNGTQNKLYLYATK